MGYGRKWKPSKSARGEYAKQIQEIAEFCKTNHITQSLSGDSYYFTLGGIVYRVSNHTVAASDRGAYNEQGEKIRPLYHGDDLPDMVCITAGKTRIIEIYEDLKSGYELDKRGKRINWDLNRPAERK